MENLDGTVVTTALPQMARSFHTDVVGLNVGITAYLLALAVFVPMSGWLSDRLGARTVFASAIAVFTLASVLCGFARTVPEFVVARVIQGMGGAMMVPVGRLVVLRNTEKRDLVNAISTIVWPGLVAPVLGPPVGGFIVDHASWRWIFYLNVPLGLVAFVLALGIVPNVREEVRPPFDWAGFALVGAACVLFSVGLDRLQWPLALGGVLAAIAAVRHLRRAPHPLLVLDAFRIRTFGYSNLAGALARCSIGGMPFLLALYFQIGFGLTALAAGGLLLWVFAGNLGMKTFTTAVLRRFGFRPTLIVNGGVAALSILAVAFLGPHTPVPIVAATLFVGGMCRSMQFTALNTLGFADVPPGEMTGANTLASTLGGLTYGAGPAVGALALQVAAWLHRTAGPPTLADFRFAIAFMALLVVLSILDTWRLPRDVGMEVSGHRA